MNSFNESIMLKSMFIIMIKHYVYERKTIKIIVFQEAIDFQPL